MTEIVFLLEEPSAKAMLEGFLPKILPKNAQIRFIVFEGKQDLEKQLVRKIRVYRVPEACFIVLRDQDAGDCMIIKKRLAGKFVETGRKSGILIRIACHELESWYLADLAAVERGLEVKGLARLQNKNPYRSPDSLPVPSAHLARIAPSYQKLAGSRAISPHLDPENSRSCSFAVFVSGIRRLTAEL